MSKKMKLDINNLKVQSFTTKLSNEEGEKINGGFEPYSCHADCGTAYFNDGSWLC